MKISTQNAGRPHVTGQRGAVFPHGHRSSSLAIPPRASFQIQSAAGTRRIFLSGLAPVSPTAPGSFMARVTR